MLLQVIVGSATAAAPGPPAIFAVVVQVVQVVQVLACNAQRAFDRFLTARLQARCSGPR
jgi:hypothetical protein